MQFFTADIHFADIASMNADFRPFKSIKAYDKFIIKDWNRRAKPGDEIYIVGDLLDCNDQSSQLWKTGLKYMKKIKANVILIIGNNEQRVIKYFFENDFSKFRRACLNAGIKEVYENLDISFARKKFHLTHQSKDVDKSKINLFGHTHICSGVYHPYGLCVSTDLNHFRLFTEDQILSYLERKKDYWEPDPNTNYVNPFLVEQDGEIVNIKARNNKKYREYVKINEFD